jgi:hypothetical protein
VDRDSSYTQAIGSVERERGRVLILTIGIHPDYDYRRT